MADNWNKMKNMASKVIGEKMKVRQKSLLRPLPQVLHQPDQSESLVNKSHNN